MNEIILGVEGPLGSCTAHEQESDADNLQGVVHGL